MNIHAIVAFDENYAMGRDNKLPWHISDDLKIFKRVTSGHAILMGRKTFDSIGKPLPNRLNIVMSRYPNANIPGAELAVDMDAAKAIAEKHNIDTLYIIGGAEMFKLWQSEISMFYISKVQTEIKDADTFFPSELLENTHCDFRRDYSQSKKNEFGFTLLHFRK